MPTPYEPRKILLTGATGFVGSYLHAALMERWPSAEVVGLSVNAQFQEDRTDILDRAAITAAVAKARPDVVVHLAAQASVALGAKDEGATWAVNLSGTLHLALAVAAHAPEAIVLFASSSEVYGESFRDGPVDEASPLRPTNAYARSKALAEQVLAEILGPQTRLIVARPFNHTGPGQSENFVMPSFVRQAAQIEAGLQEPKLCVGNIDVSRDFLDVRDVVAAYTMLIAAAPQLQARFTCNVASDRVEPLRHHLETLRGLSRREFSIKVDPSRLRPVDLPVAAGQAYALHAATGWTPHRNMAVTLSEMLEAERRKIASSL